MKSLKLKIENYEFEVPVFEKDGKSWVALRPLCAVLGIQFNGQWQKAQKSERLVCSHICIHDSSGRKQEMLCIEIKSVGAWIFGINPNKVSPEIKDKLVAFQDNLQHVLYAAVAGHIDTDMVASLVKEIEMMRVEYRRENRELRQVIQNQQQTIDYLLTKDTLNEQYVDKQLASVGGKLLSNVSAKRRKAPVLA